MHSSTRRCHWITGFLGLTLLPVLLLLDTYFAMGRGWVPASAGSLASIRYVAVVFVLFGSFSLIAAPFRRWLARHSARLWLLSASTLLAFAIAEIGLLVDYPRPSFHCRLPSSHFLYDPDPFSMPGVIGTAATTINADGVRGSEMPTRDQSYRILCVGGSTTECYYLDDKESWPSLFASDLGKVDGKPVWVGSVGYSEYSSAHHLHFLETSSLVDHVDAVILLVGGNDLVRSLLGYGARTAATPLWLQLGPVDLLREIWNVRLRRGLVVDSTGESLRTIRLAMSICEPATPIPWNQELQQYRERLMQIVGAAHRRNLKLLLVSQPVLWSGSISPYQARRLWFARTSLPREWQELTMTSLRRHIDAYNDALRQVANETNTPFLDASGQMSGNPEYFYDDYHFNERGNVVFAELLASYWSGNQLTPPANKVSIPQ